MTNELTHHNRIKYFKGLDALRFFAAFLVMLMHMRSNQGRMGLEMLPEWPVFFKGLVAVSFFFVLSGFLITYLLLGEQSDTGTVSIKRFYMKRIFRIWPLYFIVIAIGAAFYWYIAPRLGIDFEVNYKKSTALFLYVFFGANLMNSLYHVGGILHITWSIAVEEQFYLFWAPLVKKFKDNIPMVLASVFAISLTINILNAYNVFGLSEGWKQFVHTLQFHYMAMGGYFAYLVFKDRKKIINHFFFKSKLGQLIPLSLLLAFLLFYFKIDVLEPLLVVPTGLLFAWLIINVSINPNKLFGLDIGVFNYLGKISYGLYMYHMIVIYAISFLASKFVDRPSGFAFQAGYIILVLVCTVVVASISYYLIENKILRRGKKIITQTTPPYTILGTQNS